MSKFGIDVSDCQGAVTWSSVKAAGVEFAILRTVRGSLKPDHYFEANYNGCRENGILVGAYKYSYAVTAEAARKEAEAVLKLLNGRPLDLPVFFDAEDKCQRVLSGQLLTQIIRTFLETIKGGGYQAAIYCNLDWYRNVIDVRAFAGVDFWVARYGDNDGQAKEKWRPNVGEVGWQYTSRGKISGIVGDVDLDLLYKDYTGGQGTTGRPDVYNPIGTYRNGSTPEPVYSSTAADVQIGSLDPGERCDCLGVVDNMAVVLYRVNGTSRRKAGFVKWLGGIKE